MSTGGDSLPGARGPEEGGTRAADALIVAQVRGGDAAAARRFVRLYEDDLYNYLLSLTGVAEEAEDLAQETFVQAWRGLDTYGHRRASLRTWLHAIARARFRKWQRKRPRLAPLPAADRIADPRAAAALEAVEVRAALERLPAELRDTVVLHYLQGHTCEEIALLLDRPEGTVKRGLREARARLRREWGGAPPREPGETGRDDV